MAALPSLRQLSYLVTLSETLNFTEAARRSFVTQSTLSGGIMELERLLGGAVVERTRHQVRLTPLGHAVTERARQLLADSQDLMSLSQSLAEPMTGTVHVGVIPTIAAFVLSDFISDLHGQMPNLSVVAHELTSQVALDRLREGRLDAVLLALPFEVDNLQSWPIAEESLMLVTHKDDPMPAQQRADALPTERLLLLEEGHCLRDHVLEVCPLRDPQQTGNIEISSLPTLLQMIEAGQGFSLLPAMAATSALLKGYPKLRVQALQDPPRRVLALVSRKSSTRQMEIEQMVQALKDRLSGLSGRPPAQPRKRQVA